VNIYTGRTLIKDKEGNFVVEKTNGKIIRDRFVKSEGLLLLVHPHFIDGQFEPIHEIINECRKTIEDDEDVTNKDDKLKFLAAVQTIFKEFAEEERPIEKAMNDFDTILANQADSDVRHYIQLVREKSFANNINRTLADHYKDQTKCFSGVMTNADLLKFWSDENAISKQGFGPKPLALIKYVIRQFLGGDLPNLN